MWLLRAIVALCFLDSARVQSADDLCYRIQYGYNFETEALLIPATKYPSLHPKAQGTCGTASSIPTTTEYMEQDCDIDASWLSSDYCSCIDMGGANAFYAYNYPLRTSSNTGYEEANTLLLFFLEDTNLDVYFVMVNDKADDGSGGRAKLNVAVSPASAGENLRLKGADDSFGYIRCGDLIDNWVDSEGDSCAKYESEGWCDGDGVDEFLGTGFKEWFDDFEDYAVNGKHAGDVCCVCGGGDKWCQDVAGGCEGALSLLLQPASPRTSHCLGATLKCNLADALFSGAST
ncbi:hypothetical protein CYMTET_34020 [Cymbomonas tetramitiformis]|uniref:Uncharacterized protein n=1 Tax=Cymbomonas tetramitiformis TaxID=36881 RepID=A0AAE0FC27_9CHLO|nr:hypothetical protein CYMTET_34020 [Cymbomonas tetramitiformis]